MAEHTPGPWKANRRLVERLPSGAEFYDTEIVTAWEHPQLKSPAPVVCRYTHLKGDGTAEHGVYIRPADADLIAAAPGLLEACKALLECERERKAEAASVDHPETDFSGPLGGPPPPPDLDLYFAAVRKARKAVAKAEGRDGGCCLAFWTDGRSSVSYA